MVKALLSIIKNQFTRPVVPAKEDPRANGKMVPVDSLNLHDFWKSIEVDTTQVDEDRQSLIIGHLVSIKRTSGSKVVVLGIRGNSWFASVDLNEDDAVFIY